jgi:hypothetical protein
MGPRHMPLNAAFMNGTVTGEDVWVPMSNILGGQQRCGFGWHMFVECLAEGRGVSLPAGALGAARTVCAGVGAYSRVRKQFRVPIAEFGGIQEALARAGRESYIVLAGTELTNAIIDNHEAPMVLSSIMKQSCTERGRRIITDGMDILGGAGISQGKANFVGSAYMSMPVAITVEGANIMTRSFQIIGQGLTRCHPHMLPAINALQSKEPDAPAKFRTHLFKVLGHVFSNWGLSLTRGIGASISTALRSKQAYRDGDALVKYHEAQLLRLSANFAFAADVSLTLGGRLKFEELLMGRLSDAMSAIFLGYATLHHFQRNRHIEGLEALAESAMLQLEHEAQSALQAASENFPQPIGALGGWLMAAGVAPLGELMRPYRPPRDELTQKVARMLTTPSAVHAMFAENVYMPKNDPTHRVAALVRAMPVCLEADRILMACKKERREATIAESKVLQQAEQMRDELVQVDVHQALGPLEVEGYTRPAILGTQDRLQAGAINFEAALKKSAAA